MKCQSKIGQALTDIAAEYGIVYSNQEADEWGRLIELYLSHILLGTSVTAIREWQYYLKESYGNIKLNCQWYDKLWIMLAGNDSESSDFELYNTNNKYIIQHIKKEHFIEALDFCREGF